MRRTSWLAAVLTVLALCAVLGARHSFAKEEPRPVPEGAEFQRFLFAATLEGALEDGLPDELARVVLEQDAEGRYRNFVYACPVCTPVIAGLLAFGLRGEYEYSVKGELFFDTSRVPERIVAELRSASIAERRLGVEHLVDRWVRRRVELLRLDDAERALWRDAMERGRKKGMAMLEKQHAADGSGPNDDMETCPNCDGSVDAFGRR